MQPSCVFYWDAIPVFFESQCNQGTDDLLWKSPKYKFRVPNLDGDGLLKEIAIDVTGSAPSFPEPSQFMQTAIEHALAQVANISKPRILDVGAGKLRTTLYILRKHRNSKLWAVEYEQLRTSTKQARAMYVQAEGFLDRFNPVVFPHEFVKLTGEFDLAIVANVLGTMPIPAERLLLLQYCHQKVRDKGHLLWYSQHNEGDYAEGGTRCNNATRLGDGFHIGQNRYRTFYRDIPAEEVDQLLLSCGFRFTESIPAGHNIARIYKKSSPNLFAPVLKRSDIEVICKHQAGIPDPLTPEIKVIEPSHKTVAVLPDPNGFSIEDLCIERLSNLGVGGRFATEFHRLSELIMARIFQNSLRKFEIEKEINEGTKRVDIVAKNFANKGFFRRLDSHYHIPCANVFIECKNYNDELANPETDQISTRLRKDRGMFGILIYRKCEDRLLLRTRLKQFLPDRYVIDLDQDDLIKLLRLRKQGGRAQIDDLLEARLDILTLSLKS
jgi:hypothetical protein